jgi:long-subunit acyl-CoA synthetase (AMP-forming)
VLTHGNVMFELGVVTQELDELFELDDASTLLFLPLAHIFARIIEVGCVRAGVRLGHTADIKDLLASFEAFQPTFILAVPRVFEKVFNSASQRAQADGRGKVFDAAARTSIEWSRAQDEGGAGSPPADEARAVRPPRLRESFGPRSAAARGTPCRAELRWASASPTSSAASECRCSRGTASPRPPPH